MRWLLGVAWVLVLTGCGGSDRTVYTCEVTDANGTVYSNMTHVHSWGDGATEFTDSAGRTHVFKGSHHYVKFAKQKAE